MKNKFKFSALVFVLFVAMCMAFSFTVSADESTIRINFQTKGSETPEGFLPDAGEEYGDRGNGYTYGWNRSNVGNARDYSLMEKDLKLATLNQFGEGYRWEIEVPNGTYEVTVSIGDIQYPFEIKGKLLLLAEDVVLFENSNETGRWVHVKEPPEIYVTKTVEVEVTDGRLTLDPKDSAHKNIKINYIEITSLTGTIPSNLDSSDDEPNGSDGPTEPIDTDTSIKLYVDGKELIPDVKPVLQSGRVMVPIRVIAEATGADVAWHQEKNAVLINSLPSQARDREKTVQLIVGGIEIKPDSTPFVYEGRTMVPIRWVSEALGLQVTWDQANRSVSINEKPHTAPSSELVGWAAVEAEGLKGTTGGGDAEPQIARTREEFAELVSGDTPRVVIVSGTINSGVEPISIGSNKTIIGEDKYATIVGGIRIDNQSNIIIRNLNFQGIWPIFGPADTIAARYSHHLWFDHLSFWDASDGLLDLTQGTSYVTVSWSKFFYTDPDNPHRLASLVGGGAEHEDTDIGRNKVTYHHNWFANNVNSRMPRLLFGQGHVFNNYYSSEGSSYSIGVGVYAAMLIENNYFHNVRNPHQFMYPDRRPAYITATGNVYDNTSGRRDTGAATPDGYEPVVPFTEPPYEYSLDDPNDIPFLVRKYAGPQ